MSNSIQFIRLLDIDFPVCELLRAFIIYYPTKMSAGFITYSSSIANQMHIESPPAGKGPTQGDSCCFVCDNCREKILRNGSRKDKSPLEVKNVGLSPWSPVANLASSPISKDDRDRRKCTILTEKANILLATENRRFSEPSKLLHIKKQHSTCTIPKSCNTTKMFQLSSILLIFTLLSGGLIFRHLEHQAEYVQCNYMTKELNLNYPAITDKLMHKFKAGLPVQFADFYELAHLFAEIQMHKATLIREYKGERIVITGTPENLIDLKKMEEKEYADNVKIWQEKMEDSRGGSFGYLIAHLFC